MLDLMRERGRGQPGALQRRWAVAAVTSVMVAMLGLTANAFGAPQPFGHSCQAQNGVRFCPTISRAERVPTFDGVPLDVDVTLPAQGNGPFPAIVMLHGGGGIQTSIESTSQAGGDNSSSARAASRAASTCRATGRGATPALRALRCTRRG